MNAQNLTKYMGGQSSGRRLPEGAATVMEAVTMGRNGHKVVTATLG